MATLKGVAFTRPIKAKDCQCLNAVFRDGLYISDNLLKPKAKQSKIPQHLRIAIHNFFITLKIFFTNSLKHGMISSKEIKIIIIDLREQPLCTHLKRKETTVGNAKQF